MTKIKNSAQGPRATGCNGRSAYGLCAAPPLYRVGRAHACGRHIAWLLRHVAWHLVDHVEVYRLDAPSKTEGKS